MSFEMFCRDWNLPASWEKFTDCCPQACKPQINWNLKVDDADSPLPYHHQKNVQELIMPCPLNHYYKTPHHPLQVSTHTFEDISPLWTLLPCKSIKPFLSTSLRLCLQGRIWHPCTESNLWHHLGDGTGGGWVFIIRQETKWLGNPF